MPEDFLPSNVSGQWLTFDEIQAAMDRLPDDIQVVSLTAGKLPCRQKGCCDINFMVRRLSHGSTDWPVVRGVGDSSKTWFQDSAPDAQVFDAEGQITLGYAGAHRRWFMAATTSFMRTYIRQSASW